MSKMPQIPLDLPQEHRKFLQRVKEILEQLPEAFSAPPGLPSIPRVKPLPGGNAITFTGGTGATKHILYISPTPTWNPNNKDNHQVDLGVSTLYTHIIGQAGVTQFYWIAAARGGKITPIVGPAKGVTLGLGTPAGATPGTGAQPGNTTTDTSTGLPVINNPRLRGPQFPD